MDSAEGLLRLARTDVTQEIPAEEFMPLLANPPFVGIEGTFNTRDLGMIPDSPLRANYAFRSGGLGRLTDEGKDVVIGLGIKRIFDLRSPEERSRAPNPEIAGVENTWIQSSRPGAKIELTKFISGVGEAGYEQMYLHVIDIYQPSFRAVLEHVRDRPQEPFLVHCTAGRDRTGVISGLLLTLAGASPNTILLDYLLSRIGIEPVRKTLLGFALAGLGVESTEAPGFYNFSQLREESWDAFVTGVQREYGGFEQFVTDKLEISEEDLARIKANLRTV